MFSSIQAFRGFAAVAVVTTHTSYAYEFIVNLHHQSKPDIFDWGNIQVFGAAGVSLFFVISGFVMALQIDGRQGSRDAEQFSINRVSRIVPLYWLATLAFYAVQPWHAPDSLQQLLASMFFVPLNVPQGTIYPVLAVGWTLIYEAFFYVLLVGLLLLHLPWWTAVAFLAATLAINPLSGGQVWSLGVPIVLNFAAGMVVFHLHRLQIVRRIAPVLFLGGAAALLSTAYWYAPKDATGWETLAAWGMTSTVMVLGATAWELSRPGLLGWRPFLVLGEASYALYLLHMFLYNGKWNPMEAVLALPNAPDFNAYAVVAVTVAGITAFAIAFHYAVERPLNSSTRRVLYRVTGLSGEHRTARQPRLGPALEARAPGRGGD